MPKFKEYNQYQPMLLPPLVSDCLPADHICFVINDIVEKIDISSIISSYSKNGCLAYHPGMMIKILFYAYSQGIRSSRKIEKSIYENNAFRFLSANQCPDHGTINLFRKNHLTSLENIFAQIVVLCSDLKIMDPTNISIDGTILKANASKKNTFNLAEIDKAKKRIRKILAEAEKIDTEEDKKYGKNNRGYDQIPARLADTKTRQREIGKLIDKMKKLEGAEKQIKNKQNKVKNETALIRKANQHNNHNTSDNDANLMKMKNSKACRPAYNGQIATSNQIITAYDITDEAIDEPSLETMINKTENTTKQKVETAKADCGYWSKNNIDLIKQRNIDAYLPDRRKKFEERGLKNNTLDKYHRVYFKYNKKLNEFICPEGRSLRLKITNRDKNGNIVSQRYFCSDCENCQVKSKCTKTKQKQLCIDWKLENYKSEMRKKLNSKKGKRKYLERMSEVEPVFGNIIYNQNAGHFLCRGKPMVKIEFGLSCIAHNLIKIANWLKKSDNNAKKLNTLMSLGATA